MFDPTVDKPGILTGIAEFLLGIIFFPLVCYSIQRFLRTTSVGIHLCEHFSISNNGIHDISNKLTSSTFAVLACSTGVFVMRQCNNDILAHRFYVLDNYLIFGVSYFFYDVGSMYMVYSTLEKEEVSVSAKEFFIFLRERPLIIFHHIFVPVVGFPAMMYFRGGYADCLLGTSFLIEASTPFVSLRVILVHLQKKESLLYVINGLLMVISFFFCRVMLFPMLFWWYSSMTGLSLITTFFSLPMWVHLGVLGLWTPQLMWFNKMLRGSIKVIMEQMDRMEGKKKQKKETKIYENDVVMHEELSKDEVMKSEDSEDSEEQLRQKLD
eukprot:TRINITY_DN52617_c0_g1_i1.p1 TRINITY_DN52617_c0_g1~~TRINITY_DN52617_c0_g1_i1.p1  ORF type:complete len:324 (+),score=44.96 TRINITY_DN52617_c0_g1_i1:880-1851(+)